MVLSGEKARFMAEVEVQAQMRRAAVPNLLVQQIRTTATGKDDQLREGEDLVEAGELSSAIVVTNWDTSHMTVLKVNQQAGEEPMLLSQRMQRRNLKKRRTHVR